jgi:hypothetical protein
MPLKKIPLKAGFNKQDTATAAEGQWIDGDLLDLDMAILKK